MPDNTLAKASGISVDDAHGGFVVNEQECIVFYFCMDGLTIDILPLIVWQTQYSLKLKNEFQADEDICFLVNYHLSYYRRRMFYLLYGLI